MTVAIAPTALGTPTAMAILSESLRPRGCVGISDVGVTDAVVSVLYVLTELVA